MQLYRATSHRRCRGGLVVGAAVFSVAAGVLSPSVASADPETAAQALEAAEQAAQQLTHIDEQVHQAEIVVQEQTMTAEEAEQQAAAAHAAVAAFEPQLRAIALTGYTGQTQSRVAAFLTSDSATDLVDRLTTLDLIADHTNGVIAEADAAKDAAVQAQAVADEAAARAQAGLDELEQQKAQLQEKIDAYEADFARLSAEEQAALTAAIAGPSLDASAESLPLAPSSAASAAVSTALAQVGDPYVWGGSGPDGFDCSGLTSYAWAAAGVALPHSSAAQSQLGREVPRSELLPGDLVYFYEPVSHVGLYIGNGMMVHARTYNQPVAVTSVDQGGYRGARRIFG